MITKYLIIADYLKKIIKKNNNFALGSGSFIEYLIKKINFKKMGIKNIIPVSKKIKKVLKKKNNIKILDLNKKIDFYIGYNKKITRKYFIKNKAAFSREKIAYYNAKKRIIITEKISKKENKLTFEIIPSLRKYITIKTKNLKIILSKSKKKLLKNEDNLNIINLTNIKKNIFLMEARLKKIKGIINSGLFGIIKKTKIIKINKNKVSIF